MNLIVKPISELKGDVFLPASKSYSIRAFMVASCGGQSTIIDPSNCDDALVSMNAAKQFGSKITAVKKGHYKINSSLSRSTVSKIHVKESGTVLRFVLPLLASFNRKGTVTGEGTLAGRPNKYLNDSLRKMGAVVKGKGSNESVPIVFGQGDLKGGNVSIDGTISSQFISALLITCPQLSEHTTLRLTGRKLVSLDYITMTLQVLKLAGIKIVQQDKRTFKIAGNQKFKGLKNFFVPSDYGLAAFHLAAAALVPSNITLKGHLNKKLIQADGYILPLLKKMGVTLTQNTKSIKMRGPFQLKGGNFSLKDAPDLVPIASILALFAKGKTRLTDIEHARTKESDRISDLRKELLKIGAQVKETKNELMITPKDTYKSDVTLNPHHDHRLAMAFSVLGLKIGAKVKDIECTHKSYPDYIRDFNQLGAKAKRSR